MRITAVIKILLEILIKRGDLKVRVRDLDGDLSFGLVITTESETITISGE